MSAPALLSQDQTDALQEVTNIAMGQAGSSLANILGVFVNLSVPRIRVLDVVAIGAAISDMVGPDKEITAARQSFHGTMRGEALVIYDQEGCMDLADLMGYEEQLEASAERELILDVSNVLVGACLGGIADLLEATLTYSAPSIMAERIPVDRLIDPKKMTWNYALLVEVNFTLEERNFTSHLTFLMPEESIQSMGEAIDKFMESF
ncbi:MAG: chemotaxis protein CheC [Chitinivorax sp.]